MTQETARGASASPSIEKASIAELFALHNRGDLDGRSFRVEIATREISAKPFFVRFIEGYPVFPSRIRDFAEQDYDRRDRRKRQITKA